MMMTTTTAGHNLTAYYCETPKRLENYAILPRNVPCNDTREQNQNYGSYSIVQKQAYSHANGFKCSRTVSRFTFICTNSLVASHQRLAAIPEIEVPQEMSRDECQRLARTEKYEGPDGKQHKTPLGHTTILTFFEKGRQEVSGSTLVCQGEQVKVGDRVIDGVAILEQQKISLSKRRFRVNTKSGSIEVKEEHLILPCTPFYHFRATSDATFLWEELTPTQFQKVRHLSARKEFTGSQSTPTSEEEKVRLVLGDIEKVNGRSYYSTRYEDIYVVEGDSDYLDPFPSDHLRLTSWIACRDDYITYAMENKIKEAYHAMENGECENRKDILHTQMSTTYTNPDGAHHIHLGHNRFAALLGEAVYSYECQEVTVQPRTESRCTRELPVQWEGHRYYLEAVSRLLKKYGSPVPCSHLMPNKFKTDQGHWIAASPGLMTDKAPKGMMDMDHGFDISHEDMEQGGLYTNDQLNEFTKLLNYPRTKTVVANSILQEACHLNRNDVCTTFMETLGPPEDAPTNILNLRSKILSFLHNFREASAIFIAVYIIGAAVKGLLDTIVSCVTLRHVEGRRRWWQPLLPVKWIVSYDYGQASARAKYQQRTEQRERAFEFKTLRENAYDNLEANNDSIVDDLGRNPGFDKEETKP